MTVASLSWHQCTALQQRRQHPRDIVVRKCKCAAHMCLAIGAENAATGSICAAANSELDTCVDFAGVFKTDAGTLVAGQLPEST